MILLIIFPSSALAKGQLLLIGGGNRSQEILTQMVNLAGGKILIIPLASSIPREVSESAKTQLINAGAKDVAAFSCQNENVDRDLCLKEIEDADLIYFTGGSQNALLSAFEGTRALEIIRKRFSRNLHLAGTSAGTAIMSGIMLTGNPLPPFERMEGVRKNMVETTRGFGFVKSFILDQHFLKRNRQDRLLSAVLDNPSLVGVGIDESTAILLKDDESFTVIGDSQVMVMDARHAQIRVLPDGSYDYQNVSTSLLAPGTSYKLP